jgi:hypothetical protein
VTSEDISVFRRNRSTIDQIFYTRQILEKKWEYNETVHQVRVFIDFRRAYDLFGSWCLNETYGKVRKDKHLSDSFPIQNGLKQGDALSPLLFNFALEYVISKVQ